MLAVLVEGRVLVRQAVPMVERLMGVHLTLCPSLFCPTLFCVLCVSGRRQSFRTASAPARQATLERLAALQQLLGEPALSQPGPTQLPHRQQALCGIQALLEDCQAMWDGDSE